MENIVDYFIVGQGLAGTFFAQELLKNNKSFIVIADQEKSASHISAGVYNPVVLKRFTPIWLAKEQIKALQKKVTDFEILLEQKFHHQNEIYKIFDNEGDVKVWKKKATNYDLQEYLEFEIEDGHQNINSKNGLGKVHHAGRIEVQNLLQYFREYLLKNEQLIEENFDYNELMKSENNRYMYKGLVADKLVFCEGTKVLQNPFFDFIPIIPNKGESLKVKLEQEIDLNCYKKKVYLFKDVEDYYVGATYDWSDTSKNTTEAGKQFLISSLEQFYKFHYQITEHNYAFRPTLQDRRPVLGQHQTHENMYIFNGLGTRGTLNGAYFSTHLYDYIENHQPLMTEIDVARFQSNNNRVGEK